MKFSRSQVNCKVQALPNLKFEHHRLTSFAGLVIIQQFFQGIGLRSRLDRCFAHRSGSWIYRPVTMFLVLVTHVLLGFRELRDSRYYRDDPIVQRVLGVKRVPDVATMSRFLRDADERSVTKLRGLLSSMVIERLAEMKVARITLDFDGSVMSTSRGAEGTAVGFNKKKKGARSYYPLFCTVAQTGQVLDFLHRSGNVHDSNGAREFILACVRAVLDVLPHVQIEVRMDSAFFSDDIVTALDAAGVEFTISVPFERFPLLKQRIEGRQRWRRFNAEMSYFEAAWKPKAWSQRHRFLVVRKRVRKQQKGPVQLDLFIPYEHGYEFKVIVTNKSVGMKTVVAFHDGRGSQEDIFGQLKSQCQMGYVPVRRRAGNEMYLLASLFAHNLARELQMTLEPPSRSTTPKRAACWVFQKLDTLRRTVIQRAGRITHPNGRFTLTVSANPQVAQDIIRMRNGLEGSMV